MSFAVWDEELMDPSPEASLYPSPDASLIDFTPDLPDGSSSDDSESSDSASVSSSSDIECKINHYSLQKKILA